MPPRTVLVIVALFAAAATVSAQAPQRFALSAQVTDRGGTLSAIALTLDTNGDLIIAGDLVDQLGTGHRSLTNTAASEFIIYNGALYTFTAPDPRGVDLYTTVSPSGAGSVDIVPPAPHNLNDRVALTAQPNAGSEFARWTGDLRVTANPADLLLTREKSVTAVFERDGTVFLDVNIIGEGTVLKDPDQGSYTPGTAVTLTAVPGTDYLFDYWVRDLDAGTNPEDATIQITVDGDRMPTARFVSRPGLSDVDMLQDLEDFLLTIGETETIETWDRNGLTHDSAFNRVYIGNGMPDAMELYLVERVLKTRRLGLTRFGGVSHDVTWDMWAANLAQAEADLPNQEAFVHRIVAAYMTHGTFESSVSIQDLVHTHFGAEIDPMNYQLNGRRYFAPHRDADNDGTTNQEEWEIAAPTGDFADKDAFASAALDGQPPGGSGSASAGSSNCANAACLEVGEVEVRQALGRAFRPARDTRPRAAARVENRNALGRGSAPWDEDRCGWNRLGA
jgi:hypothetical protein